VPTPQSTNTNSGLEWPRFAEARAAGRRRLSPCPGLTHHLGHQDQSRVPVNVAESVPRPSQLHSQGDACRKPSLALLEAATGRDRVGDRAGRASRRGAPLRPRDGLFPERGDVPQLPTGEQTLATASGYAWASPAMRIEKRVGPARRLARAGISTSLCRSVQ